MIHIIIEIKISNILLFEESVSLLIIRFILVTNLKIFIYNQQMYAIL